MQRDGWPAALGEFTPLFVVALLWVIYATSRTLLPLWLNTRSKSLPSFRPSVLPPRFTSRRDYGIYGLICLGLPGALAAAIFIYGRELVGSPPAMVAAVGSGIGSLLLGLYGLTGRNCQVVVRLEKIYIWSLRTVTWCGMGIIALLLVLLLEKTIAFFSQVSILSFLGGVTWAPTAQGMLVNDKFGTLPLLWGTGFITFLALMITLPVGLMAAIYLSSYARSTIRNLIKPTLETMAGIPTVVYGFFAAIVVAPWMQSVAVFLGLPASSQSAAAAGSVMGLMLLPMFVSLADDILSSVPAHLTQGSLGLGATLFETIWHVILPAAKPSLISAFLLTLSRAIGETMLVVMAAGLTANLTLNPFASVTTFTVQIVSLLTGDQDFTAPETLAAYALGMLLFLVTFGINVIAARFQRGADT